MKWIITSALAVLVAAGLSSGITIHVPGNYPTIQQGINASIDGDTVLVAPGTYHETINFSGKEIRVISEAGAESTVIDGDSTDTVVLIISGEGAGTVLEGFTITGGFGQYVGSGGIHIAQGAVPTIRGNIIRDNGEWWSALGGGISAYQASPTIEYNEITLNDCIYEGGGIHLSNCGGAIIRNNTIADNYVCSGYGVSISVGIHIENSLALIENNIIVNNVGQAPSYGGGINLVSGTVYGSNFNDLWGNTTPDYQGCIAGDFDISADPMFVGGYPYDYGLLAGSPCIDAGSFTTGLDPDGSRADMGTYYYDLANINVAIVPAEWPVSIPAGGGSFSYVAHVTNHTASQADFDVWFDVRIPDGTIVDLMARENLSFSPDQHAERELTQNIPGNAISGEYTYMVHTGDYQMGEIYHEVRMPFTKEGSDGSAGSWDLTGWNEIASAQPEKHEIEVSVNPNPFNPSTVISFQLSVAGDMNLTVYDISGRIVADLVDGWMDTGTHEVTFDAADLSSGIYVAVLESEETRITSKLALMK